MKPISSDDQSLFAADKKLTFALLCLATYILLYIKISFIENETSAFQFLEDRPEGSVFRILNTIRFVSVPLVYLWKFIVIGFVVWVGCFMYGYRVTFGQCISVVIVAEFVFLLPDLVRIIWFMFIDTDPAYHEVGSFYPLSLMSFFSYTDIYPDHKQYAYPLRALNLFEVIYWFVLVSGVHFFARKQRKIAWLIVLCSYVLLFLLWLCFYILVYK